jgi:hypothetical protein
MGMLAMWGLPQFLSNVIFWILVALFALNMLLVLIKRQEDRIALGSRTLLWGILVPLAWIAFGVWLRGAADKWQELWVLMALALQMKQSLSLNWQK